MSTIKVTSGGPIEGTFKIDFSKGPGAYELRGARGTGKTTCISSIDWLAGHKVDVTLHDGAISGKVEGYGVVAPIGGRKRRKGVFELDTIDAEKFSLTDLIDPPGKTPEVRDAHAIKALAVLSETQAEPSLYYELAGGQVAFDALGIQMPGDPVLLATRVKQAFDKLARARQNTSDAEAKRAAPLEHIPADLDMSGQDNAEGLQESLEMIIKTEAVVREQVKAAARQQEAATTARLAIANAVDNYVGPTVTEAARRLNEAATACDKAKEAEAEADKAYCAAKVARNDATLIERMAKGVMDAADDHAAAIAGWRETVDAKQSEAPTPEQIADAASAIVKARADVEQGVRIRDVKKNQGKAKVHREAATNAEKVADEARNKAGQVFDILAQSLHTEHLQIKSVDGNPRLFVKHPRRGITAFDRVNGLSDGERVDFTLRELMPHIDSPGLLPIPQRIWQDLQPTDRLNLHKLAVERQLHIVGAQVDDGELRVVYLGDDDGRNSE